MTSFKLTGESAKLDEGEGATAGEDCNPFVGGGLGASAGDAEGGAGGAGARDGAEAGGAEAGGCIGAMGLEGADGVRPPGGGGGGPPVAPALRIPIPGGGGPGGGGGKGIFKYAILLIKARQRE